MQVVVSLHEQNPVGTWDYKEVIIPGLSTFLRGQF